MTFMLPASFPHEDSVDPRPVGVNQSRNNWNSVDRACRTTNLQEPRSAGKAPCPEFQLESYTCTAVTGNAANAEQANHNKADFLSSLITDLTNAGSATHAPVVTMENLMQATNTNFLIKAVGILGAMEKSGVLFKVITADGTEYGNLPYKRELINTKIRRKYGSVSKHIDPHLAKLLPGDVAVIALPDPTDMTINDFQSRVSSRMCGLWGAGNGTCHISENTIQVMRIK